MCSCRAKARHATYTRPFCLIKIKTKSMIKGYNKADRIDKTLWESKARDYYHVKNRPCVFLSHKYEDKPACREIASYLKEAGIDYYLDEEDKALQQAVTENNCYQITERIKKGIRNSSHMLCVVSKKTVDESKWVPFEVGYGHAAIIDKAMLENSRDKKIKLSILTLKDLAEKELPDFMKVGFIIRGTKSLNDFIAKVLNKEENQIITEGRLKSHNQQNHPLDNVLNWKL